MNIIVVSGSPKEPFERVALGLVLLGIRLLEPLQVHQLPANGGQVSGFGNADQAEVRLGIMKGEQEGGDVAGQPRTDVCMQTATRIDQGIQGHVLASHPHEFFAIQLLSERRRWRQQLVHRAAGARHIDHEHSVEVCRRAFVLIQELRAGKERVPSPGEGPRPRLQATDHTRGDR